jgi:hypothetical protein
MWRTDAMAGGTGIGGRAAREILGMTDLAGCEAPTNRGIRGQLGANAVESWIGKPGGGLVVAPNGQAARDAAAHFENGDFMALGAGVDASHRLSAMSINPASGMIVPIVLGEVGTFATSTTQQ